MKKNLIVLAIVSSIIPVAQADSLVANPNPINPISADIAGTKITLYGTVDVGIWQQSKSTSDGKTGSVNAGSTTMLHSGNLNPSKWGIKGTRDLSNDMKAFFVLEEHITATTGATDAFGYPGFARQSFVGLSGKFGTVMAGEQFTPAILAYAATDPRGLQESMSGLQPWMFTSNFNNPTSTDTLGAFSHNAVSYSYNIDKVQLSTHWGLGGQAGSRTANSNWSVASVYSGNPLTLSTGYQVEDGATGSHASVKSFIGAGYSVGAISIKANYLNAKQYDLTGTIEQGNYGITGVGVDWSISAEQTLSLDYYNGNNSSVNNDKAGNLVLSSKYVYDPSTTFWVQAMDINAKSGADEGVTLLGGNGGLVQGATTIVLNTGVTFNF